MKIATAIMLMLALMLAGCGGGYQAPPKGNERVVSNAPAGSPAKGQSYAKEYEPEAKAALDSWKAWGREKTPENFAKVGAHLYNAMRFKILTDRNGHSTGNLYKVREVGQLFTDWKKTSQLGDWESNPEYKAAKAAYDEVQQ
jgi:hypothetical protein